MSKYLTWVVVSFACLLVLSQAEAGGALLLENGRLGLSFDRNTGTLAAIQNKLTGETYQVGGDRFSVEAVDFRLDFPQVKLTSLKQQGEALKARYQGGEMTDRRNLHARGRPPFRGKAAHSDFAIATTD